MGEENIVQEILNNNNQVKFYAEVLESEVLAYIKGTRPEIVADAAKMIALAKQGKMIEALSARVADESSDETADTSSVTEDSE